MALKNNNIITTPSLKQNLRLNILSELLLSTSSHMIENKGSIRTCNTLKALEVSFKINLGFVKNCFFWLK